MSTRDGGSGKVSPHVVWASLTAFLGVVGATSYVITRDLPGDQYLWISGSILAPTLGVVVNILQNRKIINKQSTATDVALETREVTDKIEKQTNGALAEQFESLKALLAELSQRVNEIKKEGEQ